VTHTLWIQRTPAAHTAYARGRGFGCKRQVGVYRRCAFCAQTPWEIWQSLVGAKGHKGTRTRGNAPEFQRNEGQRKLGYGSCTLTAHRVCRPILHPTYTLPTTCLSRQSESKLTARATEHPKLPIRPLHLELSCMSGGGIVGKPLPYPVGTLSSD
jgi:hypothetical protein